MTTLFSLGITNALIATVLAIAVWCVTRVWRQPVVAQLLWVLVLVKLVTPPLVTIPWHFASSPAAPKAIADTTAIIVTDGPAVPRSDDEMQAIHTELTNDILVSTARSIELVSPRDECNQAPANRSAFVLTPNNNRQVVPALIVVWLTGGAIWLLVAMGRLARFHRALKHTTDCSEELRVLSNEIAARLGVSSHFRLRATDANLPPLVWPIGRPTIVISHQLLGALSRDETETLLAHELAHLRRRDHWLRWFELFVTAIYWWHPVVRWTRREIQKAEEQACDAWVVWAFPDSAKRYASALFKAAQMISEQRTYAPLIASRMSSSGNLKERIEDIMNATWKCRLSLPTRIAILLAAASLLPLSLGVVRAANENDTDSQKTTKAANDDRKNKSDSAGELSHLQQPVSNKLASDAAAVPTNVERIRTGMRVAIRVAGAPPDQAIGDVFVVEPGGTVALGPVYGRVRVDGMTVAETEAALTNHLKRWLRSPSVQLTIADAPAARRRVRFPTSPYHISPGDVVRITVSNAFADAPIVDDFVVEPSGTVALGPQYGRTQIAGLTLEDAERAVTRQLKAANVKDPLVQITLGGWRNNAAKFSAAHEVAAGDQRASESAGAPVGNPLSNQQASAQELDALREHVQFLKDQFAMIDALYRRGEPGGGSDVWNMTQYELAAAQCDLTLAEGHFDEASKYCEQAVKFANDGLKAATAHHQAGRRTHDVVLQAARNLSDAKRRLLRLRDRQASFADSTRQASADISRPQREVAQAVATEPSSVSYWKKVVESKKRDYERLQSLAEANEITTSQLERGKLDYELSLAQYEHAKRNLRYAQLQLELAEAEFQQAARAERNAPNTIPELEIRKLKIKVEMAKIKVSDVE